jgi:hypothetical protein
VKDSTQENGEVLAGRLEELGVSIAPDQVEELAAAYPALLAWMRIAEELADEPGRRTKPGAET